MSDALKITVEPVIVEFIAEPRVVLTFRGYAPVVDVKHPGGEGFVYISSKSISQAIDPLVQENDGKFTGLKLRLMKETEEKMAPYVVEKVD